MKQIAKLKDDARRYELREEWDNAIDAYLQVLRLSDDELDLPLYNRVGDLYVRLGRPMDAVTHYEQAADRYADAGLFNNAIALCNKALRYDAGRLPLLRKLGAFSASQGFFTDARRWYLEYTEKSLKRGAVDEAFGALTELADISDDAEIRELLARQLREYGRDAEAIQEFKRLHASLIAAGQRQEADAIAAELKQMDPSVELSQETVAEPVEPTQDWYYVEELPGFADVEPPASAAPVEEPQPEVMEVEPEPHAEHEPETQAAGPVDWTEEITAAPPSNAALASAEAELAVDQPETTEYFDLPELSFDNLDADDEVTAQPIEDIVHDEPLDFGPIEVEVEERHELLDISALRIRPDSIEPAQPLDAFAKFEDFNVDAEESDDELPMLDLGKLVDEDEEASQLRSLDDNEEYEADLPLPSYTQPETGTIASFDESEFGDYAPTPEPRVFDFTDEEDEPQDLAEPDLPDEREENQEQQEQQYETVAEFEEMQAEAEPEAAPAASEETQFAAEPELDEDDFEFALPPEFETHAELESQSHVEEPPAFESTVEEVPASFESEPVAFEEEPAALENEPPVFEQEPADFENAPDAFEQEPVAFEEEPLDEEVAAADQPYVEHQPDIDRLVAELAFHELPPLPPPPMPPPATSHRPSFEYVDLAALLDEKGDEQAEESTRFVVAEMPPTGDEEKDFADMLQQFKEKVAQSIPKDDAGSHYDLGIAFKEMGLIDEAIGEFQTALRSGQDKLKVYEELGSCFVLKQQYSVAVTVLNRAQQLPHADDTELLGVFYNLGRAYEELGQKGEARAAFERIVAIDIGFQDTTQRLKRL